MQQMNACDEGAGTGAARRGSRGGKGSVRLSATDTVEAIPETLDVSGRRTPLKRDGLLTRFHSTVVLARVMRH